MNFKVKNLIHGKIMNRKIVIGIPSYNEEYTIGHVIRQIDLGLKKFFPKYEC